MIYHVSGVEDMQRKSRIEPMLIFNCAHAHSCAVDGEHNSVLAEACSHSFRILSMNKSH